jgi:DNA repair exonuclease SbcCD ATPase subunit
MSNYQPQFIITKVQTCHFCNGVGETDAHAVCPRCNGSSEIYSESTLKDAIKELDWSDWVREAGADLDRLEERLERLEIDMVAVKNTQGAHIKNCYHDLHDHKERLEVVEEWVRTFTDLTNSKLDWQQETNRTLYDLEERIRGLEAISEADDKWTKLTDEQLEQLELDIDGLRKLSYKLAEHIGKLERSKMLYGDMFHTELNIYEERLRVLETKLEHVEAPHNADPVYNTNQLRNTFASLYGRAKFQITHSELLNLLEEVKHV